MVSIGLLKVSVFTLPDLLQKDSCELSYQIVPLASNKKICTSVFPLSCEGQIKLLLSFAFKVFSQFFSMFLDFSKFCLLYRRKLDLLVECVLVKNVLQVGLNQFLNITCLFRVIQVVQVLVIVLRSFFNSSATIRKFLFEQLKLLHSVSVLNLPLLLLLVKIKTTCQAYSSWPLRCRTKRDSSCGGYSSSNSNFPWTL